MKFGINNRQILAVAVLLAAANILSGQSYTLSPNDSIVKQGMMEDLETLSIEQLNTSNDTLILKWQKVSEAVPASWEAGVCDNSFCNTTLIDSGTMNPVLPGEYGLLLIKITPHVNFGTARVRYAVWDAAIPAKKDTLTYILKTENSLALHPTEYTFNRSFYPNPANSTVYILGNDEKGFHYSLTDASGKVVLSGVSKARSMAENIAELPSGVYSLAVYSINNTSTIKKLIIQH